MFKKSPLVDLFCGSFVRSQIIPRIGPSWRGRPIIRKFYSRKLNSDSGAGQFQSHSLGARRRAQPSTRSTIWPTHCSGDLIVGTQAPTKRTATRAAVAPTPARGRASSIWRSDRVAASKICVPRFPPLPVPSARVATPIAKTAPDSVALTKADLPSRSKRINKVIAPDSIQ
jgi:hypothetical protein